MEDFIHYMAAGSGHGYAVCFYRIFGAEKKDMVQQFPCGGYTDQKFMEADEQRSGDAGKYFDLQKLHCSCAYGDGSVE